MSCARVAYAACLAALLAGPSLGCRSDGEDGESSGTETSTSTGPGSGGGGDGGSSGAGNNGQGGDGSGGGPIVGCEGPETSISDITTGAVGPGVKVSVSGVVAMSHKFLVSKSSSGSCLWGVFVSTPGLTTTAANTGALALSYGTDAVVPDGGDTAFCPRLGQDPAGDSIPDDVKPGDVLNLIGVTARFPEQPNCVAPNPANQVGMLQLGQVCQADLVGTATPPEPAVLTGADIAKISSTTDTSFHDQWGAVKVRVNAADLGDVELADGEVVGDFGVIKFSSGIELGNKIYYRGYSNNICHEAPVFDPAVDFASVEGFHYLNFCSWSIQPNDKCADYDPQSSDCTAAACAPDFIGD